jgi:hypothetical protein
VGGNCSQSDFTVDTIEGIGEVQFDQGLRKSSAVPRGPSPKSVHRFLSTTRDPHANLRSVSSTFLSSNLFLLSASSLLCFSFIHIIGNLISKFPSIKYIFKYKNN